MSEDPEEDSTLKVKVRESSPVEVLSPDFVADSRARTRELLEVLHSVVLGRWWAWFWGPLLGVAVLIMAVLAISRGKAPSADPPPLAMHCLSGRVRISTGSSSDWRGSRLVPVGVRASTAGPRSHRVVLGLAHDSTIRWQGLSLFSWQADADGKASVTVERGRAWIVLSPLDGMHLDFPGGQADLAPESVAELNLRPRSPAQWIVRCRHGQVKIQIQKPRRRKTLSDGQGVQLDKDGQVRLLTHFNADDGWQQWNLNLPAPVTR